MPGHKLLCTTASQRRTIAQWSSKINTSGGRIAPYFLIEGHIMLEIVILAAGKGTRMRSAKPKVLHTLAGKPFLAHVIDRARDLHAESIAVVVGHGADAVEQAVADHGIVFIEQKEQLGTGHAVLQTLPSLQDDATVLILYGDVPLIRSETLANLAGLVSDETMGLLTVTLADPQGYGRIVRNALGEVKAIVEQKDASREQQQIREVNTGVMAVKARLLKRWLPALENNNAQGEYYLTDIIAMAAKECIAIETAQPASESEVLGVNNRAQQAQLERIYQQEIAEQLMTSGVTLMDPARFDCRGTLSAGEDCVIDVNCVFEGENRLGNNVAIGPNCTLINVSLGDNTVVHANSVLENAVVTGNSRIGPFARLRPGTRLAEGARIGNFVETKNAAIGKGSKVNHLSYVGDADVGAEVNIGAGTITCNYDGVNKHRTEIGDRVFVGSNSALVAPVNLASGTTIAAGSTVTRGSTDDQLVVARARQRNIDGWHRPEKKS
ncbi:bifunctional UDP-N-acetylglucosamine diphosphorylase/glucosamine-1-phosphate N-acetyltransferase GlmU [Teredinibacter turnerae]|uniref:bifunctional UDP-N-acetylglucosamine diphosphorylase/glucosamine-1-phosphate N-acetyltransferase GlmU n=1 Tax=Teredinibacter turnerae TaxID=2426 RepID=UPI00041A13E5|nr:bifunctional UDP-N-acetylglucosamine diphosphorylase/glucosamine-1-phosphate N-acetyltransferase GlmU [Teredinibacter turnerae]